MFHSVRLGLERRSLLGSGGRRSGLGYRAREGGHTLISRMPKATTEKDTTSGKVFGGGCVYMGKLREYFRILLPTRDREVALCTVVDTK